MCVWLLERGKGWNRKRGGGGGGRRERETDKQRETDTDRQREHKTVKRYERKQKHAKPKAKPGGVGETKQKSTAKHENRNNLKKKMLKTPITYPPSASQS